MNENPENWQCVLVRLEFWSPVLLFHFLRLFMNQCNASRIIRFSRVQIQFAVLKNTFSYITFIRWRGSCYWGCGGWCLSSISAASEVMSTAENDAFIKIHRVFLGVNFLLEFFVKVERLPFKTTVHWGQV